MICSATFFLQLLSRLGVGLGRANIIGLGVVGSCKKVSSFVGLVRFALTLQRKD